MSYLHQLGTTPATLRRIVDCVPPERYDESVAEGRFTLREAVAHLADYEETVYTRFAAAHEAPGSSVPNFDEDARAIEKGYAERDVQHELEVFENRRRDTMSLLETFGEEDLRKTYVHPESGERSIGEYWTMLLGHDIYHLDHATMYLR